MAVRAIQEMQQYTPEEYLKLERKAEYKSEYINGEIWAMSGASLPHNEIAMNLSVEITSKLQESSCRLFAADMRVQTSATHYCYPDMVAVCGKPLVEDKHQDTLLNPILIIEILSPSTQRYDRGPKFERYKSIESLREYITVAQYEPRIERYLLTEAGAWEPTVVEGLESSIRLDSIGVELALARVYERVEFSAE